MISPMRKAALLGLLAMISICSSGCFQAMGEASYDKAVAGFPKYAETRATWGTVPSGCGRVVLFVDKIGMNPFNPVAGSGCTLFIYEVDGTAKVKLPDGIFVFIDLPAGKHSFKCYPVGSLYHGSPTEFDVPVGQVIYIRPSGVVSSQEAASRLENSYHLFKKPIPFDKQDKAAEKVTL
jgi:hypothetical protein